MFRELASGEIGQQDLARAALTIALEEYPKISIAEYLGRLEILAERARQRMAQGAPEIFRLGHVQAVVFDEEGFTGDRDHYFDPRNAYLNEVIERKVGLPILLSILFIDVAARVGLKVTGVGLPGHYIVKVQFDMNEVYIDPFNDGVTLTLKEIDAVLSHNSAGQVRLRPEMLRGWTGRQTLERVLANLVNIYSRVGDQRRVAAARERIEELKEYGPETSSEI
jgi:regulator of sirC expression with transglutaminase-like and TPR domain